MKWGKSEESESRVTDARDLKQGRNRSLDNRLSRLLKARSLFARVEVLVTNLVSDLEGDRRLLGDPQVQVSDLVRADDEGSSSESEDSSD